MPVNYTDGSSQSFNLNMADWFANAPAVGDQIATTTSSWNFQSNPLGPHPVSVYFASVPLEQHQDRAVGDTADRGRRRRHDGDAHLGDGDREWNTDNGRRRSLRSRRPMTTPGSVTTPTRLPPILTARGQLLRSGAGCGDADGAHGRRPGDDRRRHVHVAERSVGAPDNVIADGQIIDLSGSGDELGFLGSAGFGAASGSGTITYTDGTTQPYSISMADWFEQRPGQRRRDRHHHLKLELREQHADPASGQRVLRIGPADSGKTVKSATLPTVGSGVGNGINAMHIFSIAVGNGTPTSGG